MQPGCSESALFVCFSSGLFAHTSLNRPDRLMLPPFPTSFIHGNRDWVDSVGGELIVRNIRERETAAGRPEEGLKSQCHIIPNSDHNMQADNPAMLAQVMIGDLSGTILGQLETKQQLYYYAETVGGEEISIVTDWKRIEDHREDLIREESKEQQAETVM